MRHHTITAIFDAVFKIYEVAPALFTQCIKRTVTKQAIEFVHITHFMTREKVAFLMVEKLVLFHIYTSFGILSFSVIGSVSAITGTASGSIGAGSVSLIRCPANIS